MEFHGFSVKSLMDHHAERYGNIRVSDFEAFRQALVDPIEADQTIDT